MDTVLDIQPQIPAADPQDGDGDGSSSDSQLGVEAQTQPQSEPTSHPFTTAGRLLVFSPLKIYVGITDDQPQIPTQSPNQPVFLSFDPLMQDNYLLYDKKWKTVPEELVVFGPEYETVESRKKAALELLWNGVLWIRQRKLLKREAFIKWTLERLRWEAKFLEREWFIRGNREIFPPDTHHRQQGPGGHPRARADGALPAAAQLDFSIHDFSFSAFFFSASSLSIGIHLYKTRDVDLKMAKNDVDDAKSQTKRSENTTRRAETPTGRPSASRPIDLGFPPALPRLPSRSSSAVQPVLATPQAGQTGSQHEHLDPCRAGRSNKRIKKKRSETARTMEEIGRRGLSAGPAALPATTDKCQREGLEADETDERLRALNTREHETASASEQSRPDRQLLYITSYAARSPAGGILRLLRRLLRRSAALPRLFFCLPRS
ncbi:hypothetical protein TRV_07831 [Trichophyton verrucosum HKI 0517]|uniref:Uncharacterized protein n=1 Tax=Trichophyton verrucosum (strain HKI 0517) TaxID=663202 RepID=D4DKV7_TRIVH|nr:uncharacterized protein TRV_07831 [Trichophyton verrucosum HKI 0517]EFE37490.1 hypothetical protein TRV_07831 [Trichophyton verrucosum HKI 0517]